MADSAPLEKKQMGDADTALRTCDELEAELAALRGAYEQYFLGIERKPPTRQHEVLKKKMNQLRNMFVRQTVVKFRVNGLAQKLATYERLWTRTLQEMEDGTYRRDLFKAKLHAKKAEAPGAEKKKAAEANLDDLDVDVDDFDLDEEAPAPALAPAPAPVPQQAPAVPAPQPGGLAASIAAAMKKTQTGVNPALAPVATPAKPVSGVTPAMAPVATPAKPVSGVRPAVGAVVPPTAPAKPSAPPGRPMITAPLAAPMAKGPAVPAPAPGKNTSGAAAPVAASGSLSDAKVKAIYDAYVTAKKRCNEDTSKISVDGLAQQLRKQVPELMKQHNAKSVEFKVVIKDGKAILRALPKEG